VDKYREGKVKRTPVRGVKEYLKLNAYKQWEGYFLWGVILVGKPDRVPFV
jgi:hypothetical protein